MANIQEVIGSGALNFEDITAPHFLLGLLSAFDNRYQAKADNFFEEISWKQFFAIISIGLCRESPTIKELAEIMGSSHQNVKQILNKLEKKGYIRIVSDEKDKRKQRILLTEKTVSFEEEHAVGSQMIINKIFENIDADDIKITINTIMKMEENLEKIK